MFEPNIFCNTIVIFMLFKCIQHKVLLRNLSQMTYDKKEKNNTSYHIKMTRVSCPSGYLQSSRQFLKYVLLRARIINLCLLNCAVSPQWRYPPSHACPSINTQWAIQRECERLRPLVTYISLRLSHNGGGSSVYNWPYPGHNHSEPPKQIFSFINSKLHHQTSTCTRLYPLMIQWMFIHYFIHKGREGTIVNCGNRYLLLFSSKINMRYASTPI